MPDHLKAVMPDRFGLRNQTWLGPETLVAMMIASRGLVFIQRPTNSSVRPTHLVSGGTG